MDFFTKFELELGKEVYYPGETLSGNLLLESNDNVRVRGIQVLLRGKAHVEWKIIKAGEKRTVKEDQYFVDEKQSLWGKDRTDDEVTTAPIPILARGSHKFPFSFDLPETNLPCSFEAKLATIRYYVRAFIQIPHMSTPQGVKYFTIIAPHISCMDESYLTPITLEDGQATCCCCCLRERYSLVASLDRTAYCCGERVRVKGSVQNNHKRTCWIAVRLIQRVEFFISRGVLGMTKDVRHRVLERRSEPLAPNTSRDFRDGEFDFNLPVVPPTLLDICKLLQIYYMITISLCSQRTASKSDEEDLELEFPLTVATAPFLVPSQQPPPLVYECCTPNAEGGMYVSPEFQLGQVYMGSSDPDKCENADKDVVLYKPVYCCVKKHGLVCGEAPDITVTFDEDCGAKTDAVKVNLLNESKTANNELVS